MIGPLEGPFLGPEEDWDELCKDATVGVGVIAQLAKADWWKQLHHRINSDLLALACWFSAVLRSRWDASLDLGVYASVQAKSQDAET
jgi:hypothetical protein